MIRLIIIFCSFLIISCESELIEISDVFPLQQKSDTLLVINIDTVKSIHKLNEFICAYNYPNKKPLLCDGYLRMDGIDIPIRKSRWLSCFESRIINCYSEKTFITFKNDFFVCTEGKIKLTVQNLEIHLTKRYLNPKSLYLSDPRFSVFVLEVPLDGEIYAEDLLEKLKIMTKSYYNFIRKNIDRDSFEFYKNKYPFNLLIERPFNDVIKPVPPPKPESVVIIE